MEEEGDGGPVWLRACSHRLLWRSSFRGSETSRVVTGVVQLHRSTGPSTETLWSILGGLRCVVLSPMDWGTRSHRDRQFVSVLRSDPVVLSRHESPCGRHTFTKASPDHEDVVTEPDGPPRVLRPWQA